MHAKLKRTMDAADIVSRWMEQPLGKREFEASRDAGMSPTAAEILPALKHPNSRIRFDCLGMLDHLADESSLEPMISATRDSVPRVRRMAVHALGCQRCKPSALCSDLNAVFLPIAETDSAWRVRREAVISIVQQPASDRSRASLAHLARYDPHPKVRKQAGWAFRIQTGQGWSYGHHDRPRPEAKGRRSRT
jgi:HEAT repeat protein